MARQSWTARRRPGTIAAATAVVVEATEGECGSVQESEAPVTPLVFAAEVVSTALLVTALVVGMYRSTGTWVETVWLLSGALVFCGLGRVWWANPQRRTREVRFGRSFLLAAALLLTSYAVLGFADGRIWAPLVAATIAGVLICVVTVS